MKKIYSVIGLGFGDEGKGVLVDYLCSKHIPEETLVIRHSGGHQVGHTVKINDIIHEFRHFGSGTMRGIPTLWSRQYTVSPIMFRWERDILLMKDVQPKLFVNELSPVTTHYDIAYNRAYNRKRNSCNSVGVGFASTLIRHEFMPLYVVDLKYSTVRDIKLKQIYKHYNDLTQKEGTLELFQEELAKLQSNEIRNFSFNEECDYFIDNVIIVSDIFHSFEYKNIIFEGNQGILLDKNHGFYPNVTHGTTTNITLKDWVGSNNTVETWYATRAYSTRHGDGPFLNQEGFANIELKNTEWESNFNNENQGEFRYAPLNIDLLKYALDMDNLDFKTKSRRNIVVSCVDQLDCENAPYIFNEELHHGNILNELKENIYNSNLFVNTSPESKTITTL